MLLTLPDFLARGIYTASNRRRQSCLTESTLAPVTVKRDETQQYGEYQCPICSVLSAQFGELLISS